MLYLRNCIDVSRKNSAYRTQIFHKVTTFSIQNFPILEKTTDIGRNCNWRFAVKINEIKQLIFSDKKDSVKPQNKKSRKKWIITALVLVLALGGGSVATVMILHKNSNRSEFTLPNNLSGGSRRKV